MAKSRARYLAELLNASGLVQRSRSALAGGDSTIDLDALPTIPNSQLEHSSVSLAGHTLSLGGTLTLNTADIGEHESYLYYTNARARAAISVSGSLSYDSATGIFSYTTPTTIASLSNHSTDTLSEGSTNLYYTDARVGSYLTSNSYATQSYVGTQIANLVDSAPGTLDTLNELAAALGDDANFSTTVTNSIGTKWTQDNTKISNWDTAYGWGDHASAGYLTGNQTITLTGDVSGSGTTSIAVTIADDSHNHVISNVDGLQTALDAKLPSSSYTASDVLTKIKTVDGSGSGLDADLLDGLGSSSFVKTTDDLRDHQYMHLSSSSSTINPNNTDEAWFLTNNSNSPSSAYYWHIQQWFWSSKSTSANRAQLAIQYNGGNNVYVRSLYNNWNSWAKLWSSANDGSGSGLDADLLDGYHSAENGASVNLRTASNGYLQLNDWVQVGGGGIYSTSVNSAHLTPNSSSSYGSWRVLGTRNGYTGFLFGDAGGSNNNGQHLMWDSSGNGGMWSSANSGSWGWYYHRGNACTGYNTSTTSSSYTQYVSGAIYATGNITAYSDARIKENVVTIDNALGIVEQMRGVYYNKIDDPEKTKQIGFIAQEVDAIEGAKPLVTYAEDVDQYGVSYGNTTALLVEAIKELSQQVRDLKAELEALKNG